MPVDYSSVLRRIIKVTHFYVLLSDVMFSSSIYTLYLIDGFFWGQELENWEIGENSLTSKSSSEFLN